MGPRRRLFFIWIYVGLFFPALSQGGSFFTSFDGDQVESNGMTILSCSSPEWKAGQSCPQVSVVRHDLGRIWPDNTFQQKLRFDLSRHQSGGIMTAWTIPPTGYQSASVQFYAPNGITDHIDLGILGKNCPAVQVTGYFAMIGHNHNRLGTGYRLAIEKATPAANWLFPGVYPEGGVTFSFDPKRIYQLSISSSSTGEKVHLLAQVEEWIPIKGWRLAVKVEHTDHLACESDTTAKPEGHCPPLEGENAFFGAIFQDHPIYFDQFRIEW